MVEMEASWESSECRVDGLEGGRGIMSGVGGDSLPPRKRLLAGLRQNGWFSSSSVEGGFLQGFGQEDVGMDEESGIVSEVGGVGAEQEEAACTGCHVVASGSAGMRRIKRGTVYLRFCESCALLYNKSMFCPHCLVMYYDASLLGDSTLWLLCCRCGRSVHAECENKQSAAGTDAPSYVCPDCVSTTRLHKEEVSNGLSGSKVHSGIVGANCNLETRVPASATAMAECFSPAFKKSRMSRERLKLDDTDQANPSKSEKESQLQGGGGAAASPISKNLVPVRKPSQGMPVPLTPHDAAAAAKFAAAQAVKVALAAKENAAIKACVAVKAAAAAKVALEAAARAARAVAHAQAELQRKSANSEPGMAESASKLPIIVPSEIWTEKMLEKTFVKVEKEEKQAGDGGVTSLDDEELVQQLHRAINNSPQISCSLTPLQRNSSVKPETPSCGVRNSSGDAGRAWPRHSQTSSTEALSQPKPQQTRPRSVIHKDSKRFDSRVPRHEVKKTNEIGHNADQQPDDFDDFSPELSSKPSEPHISEEMPTMIKAEVVEGVITSPAREDLSTTASENFVELPFDAMVEADVGVPHPISDIHDRKPDFLQEILEAAVLADSVMSLEEGADTFFSVEAHRSECNGGSGLAEGHRVLSNFLAEANGNKSNSDGIVLDNVPCPVGPPNPAGQTVDSSAALQDLEMADANVALEHFGATEIVDAGDADLTLKDSGEAEATCEDDADMVVTESAVEVVRADHADIALKDFGADETMHADVPSRVTHVGVSEDGSETVLGGLEDVVVEGGLEDNPTADGKDSRPGCKVAQDVVSGVLDCIGISEAGSECVLVGKEDDAMPVAMEGTAPDGEDERTEDAVPVVFEWTAPGGDDKRPEDAMPVVLEGTSPDGEDKRPEDTMPAVSEGRAPGGERRSEDERPVVLEGTVLDGEDKRPENAMPPVVLEATAPDGEDKRSDCNETQNMSLVGEAYS